MRREGPSTGRLTALLERYLSHTSRRGGEAYYAQGRVSRVRATPTEYTAAVRGSESYTVSLSVQGQRLVLDCSCPYFQDDYDVCKHVWAAALDAEGVLRLPPHVVVDFSEDLDDESLDDSGDRELFEDDVATTAGLSSAQRLAVAERMKRYWAERRQRGASPTPPRRPPAPAAWETFLAQVGSQPSEDSPARALIGELVYVFDPMRSAQAGGVLIELLTRERKKSGEWTKPKSVNLRRSDLPLLPDERDRTILETVCGAEPTYGYSSTAWNGYGAGLPVPSAYLLSSTHQRELTPRLCETERLLLRVLVNPLDPKTDSYVPIDWDPQPAVLEIHVAEAASGGHTVDAVIRRGDATHPLRAAMFATAWLALWGPTRPEQRPSFGPFDLGGAHAWFGPLAKGPVTVPPEGTAALLESIVGADLAHVRTPEALRVDVRAHAPRPIVRVTKPVANRQGYGSYGAIDRLDVELAFDYGGCEVPVTAGREVVFDRGQRLAWRRDRAAETTAMRRLQSFGVRRLQDWERGGTRMDVADKVLPTLVRVLLEEGWRVEADGKLYRTAVSTNFEIRSGIDWFEVHGDVDFGEVRADLPTLLAAVRRGDRFVPLGDGTFGLLPEDWLARGGRVASLGTLERDHVRFKSAQAPLLDAWLAMQPQVSADERFARVRSELARFDRVVSADPPSTFVGTLRDYQRDALGWFDFLRRFGFGGCLADEMGLGKTVMVLAALDARREERERDGTPGRPSLVVVPRSLVFNWRDEAARFAPRLRVLDFTGSGRRGDRDRIAEHDIVLTTYGTLRRDAGHLKDLRFEYAILDEAQAIKNARTNNAKAARLLQADYRLALSGTPVENRLGDLWSLFEFLNPGMLGTVSAFADAGSRAAEDETLGLLARGLRPFILRRTKEQVATELPARTEQTVFCDLEPPQRALYNELRDHYRASLLGRIEKVGLSRAKIHVLEALLRLRQAACHPGLVDPTRASDASAKLDVLQSRLHELADEGRKVLVFSQFTSLLGLLRTRLDEAGLSYEYLDGRTRDRAARVERFQHGGCPLFLISLKAGGLGLNLTAAEYVFLLDPWWNPAVEAQAIDRTHRIGQTRPVFALRLIARDTVEEKVLILQDQKRKLADAIIRADDGLIADLRREDLELLLS